MTEIYTVTLHSPMGPREGRLEMTYCGKLVKGAISCDSVLHLIAGELFGTADTSKGKMEWTGTLMETKA